MQASLATMVLLADQTCEENQLLTEVARQTQKDSKILKTLSLIATIYLPASVTAVGFSYLRRGKSPAFNNDS